MKTLKLLPAILIITLAFSLSSCMRQGFPQYSGRYKPNVEVSKTTLVSLPFSKQESIIQKLNTTNVETKFVATEHTTPEIKKLAAYSDNSQKLKTTISKSSKLNNYSNKSVHLNKVQQALAKKMLANAAQKSSKNSFADDTLLYVIVAILIPFLGVLLYEGELSSHFWICLLLTFLFYFPGLIYALYIILS